MLLLFFYLFVSMLATLQIVSPLHHREQVFGQWIKHGAKMRNLPQAARCRRKILPGVRASQRRLLHLRKADPRHQGVL
jgi:hypothetical protein